VNLQLCSIFQSELIADISDDGTITIKQTDFGIDLVSGLCQNFIAGAICCIYNCLKYGRCSRLE
jgi:hypothetical protein